MKLKVEIISWEQIKAPLQGTTYHTTHIEAKLVESYECEVSGSSYKEIEAIEVEAHRKAREIAEKLGKQALGYPPFVFPEIRETD